MQAVSHAPRRRFDALAKPSWRRAATTGSPFAPKTTEDEITHEFRTECGVYERGRLYDSLTAYWIIMRLTGSSRKRASKTGASFVHRVVGCTSVRSRMDGWRESLVEVHFWQHDSRHVRADRYGGRHHRNRSWIPKTQRLVCHFFHPTYSRR